MCWLAPSCCLCAGTYMQRTESFCTTPAEGCGESTPQCLAVLRNEPDLNCG